MNKSIITLLSVISLILVMSVGLAAQESTVSKNNYKITLPEFKAHFEKVKLDGYTFSSAANNGRGGYSAIFKNDKIAKATITFDLSPNNVFLTYKNIPGQESWKRVMYTRKGLKSYFLDTKGNKCVVIEATNLGGTFAVVSYGKLLDQKALEKLLDKSGFYSLKK